MSYFPKATDPDDIKIVVRYSNGTQMGGKLEISFDELPEKLRIEILKKQLSETMSQLREF